MLDSMIEAAVIDLDHETIKNFALKEGITLKKDEIDIIYYYIKNHWKVFLNGNPDNYLNDLKEKLRPEVYMKLESLYLNAKKKIGH